MPKINLFQNRIMILEKVYEEKTKGGIVLPGETVNRGQNGQCEGQIVHMGSSAFDYLSEEERPKIGTVVYFPKYTGYGKQYGTKYYRIMLDEEVLGWSDRYIEPEEELTYA